MRQSEGETNKGLASVSDWRGAKLTITPRQPSRHSDLALILMWVSFPLPSHLNELDNLWPGC